MEPRRLVPLTGIAAVALVIISFAVGGDPPDADKSATEIAQFYRDNDSQQVGAAFLLGFGAFFFLVWAASLRNALRRSERAGAGASTLALAGAVLFAVGLTIFGGLAFTLGDNPNQTDPTALQALHALNEGMFLPFAVGLVSFLVGAGVAIVTTGALPKWLGWLAVAGGAVGMSPLFLVGMIVLALFILITSVILTMEGEPATGSPATGAPSTPAV